MPKKGRFDFTKKNKRSGKIENVGYLDLEQDEEQSRCSLYFYGDIVSATWESMWYEEDRCPQDIADFLNQLDGYEDIDIYFNSGGGDVFAGLAIYNQLKRYDGHKVGYVDGMAASIASVIMFACDELHFATGAQAMIVVKFFHGYKCKQFLTACEAVLVEIRNQFRHFLHGHIKYQFKDFHVVVIVDVTIYLACGNQTCSVFLFFFIRHVSHLLSIAGRIHRPAALLPVDNLCDLAFDDCILVNCLYIETVTNLETCHVLIP